MPKLVRETVLFSVGLTEKVLYLVSFALPAYTTRACICIFPLWFSKLSLLYEPVDADVLFDVYVCVCVCVYISGV